MVTALPYRTPNEREMAAIRAAASMESDAMAKDGSPPTITPVAQPASRAAKTNFQTAANIGAIPKCIGLPAYHKAGIVRINRDKVQLVATPAGPHGSARTNSRPVTRNSIMPHFNQRSGLPIERWIQLWMP